MHPSTDVAAAVGALELEITAGPATGTRLSVHEDFQVGSAEQGPAALGGDRWLSPSHALFHRGPDGWAVQDLRSIEGTKVNGRAVQGAGTLKPGDVVEVGSSRIAVLADAGSSAAAASAPPAGPPAKAGAGIGDSRRDLDGKRLIATLIDSIVVVAPIVLIAHEIGHGRVPFLIVGLALALTYYFVSESLTGRTLGKRVMDLRVVRVDGRPLTPSAVAARTVLRLVDQQIACLVGMLTMILSGGRRQRLGDLAARTAVARASAPAPRPERRGRERLAFYAYPLLWLAPAVLMFLLVPESRLLPCTDAGAPAGGAEGSCLVDGGAAYDVVNTGHTLHVPGYSARLVGTTTRDMSAGRLRLRGLSPDAQVTVVGFKLAVRNTGGRPLRFDMDSPTVGLAIVQATGLSRTIQQLPPNRRTGLTGFGRGGPIRAGRTRVAWARFAIPPTALTRLRDPGFGLVLLPAPGTGGMRHVGEIRLSRAATPAGSRALAGLAG